MMSSHSNSNLKAGLRAMGLGLLAIAGSTLSVQGARVFCRFVSASRTSIATQDGYADALVDIAESICNEATGATQVIPIEEQITAVAFAQAEAVAAVVGTCSGDGNAQLQVRARRRAEAQAAAIGTASARIIASSGVCDLCEIALESFAVAVQRLTANAIAEVNLDESFEFNGEPITVGEVQRVIETQVATLLSEITGEVRTSAIDGCSADAIGGAFAGDNSAVCDVAITADDIITEIDVVANAGLEVQAFACDGVDSFTEVELKLREVAVAVAQAVSQASAFCETHGGPRTMACGLSRGTITAVARAQASAFSTAIVEAFGPECGCELSGRIDAEEVETIMAEASVSALAEVCASGTASALVTDFQDLVEEQTAEALAEAFVAATVSVQECAINLGLVAEVNRLP